VKKLLKYNIQLILLNIFS